MWRERVESENYERGGGRGKIRKARKWWRERKSERKRDGGTYQI
jgi:hypothetical protein